MPSKERIRAFTTTIWSWYALHKRDLPWRDLREHDEDRRAYKVLVSEVMLQQTQVSRVVKKYSDLLERFPSVETLAKATNREILLEWRGMGYNNRALRLRDAACTILEVHDGTFPRTMEELMRIRGIGHYTAAAIRNFAWNLPTPCLDTNIRRVLHRAFYGSENADGTWKKSDGELLKLAQVVLTIALEGGDSAQWHHALMDYGALVEKAKRIPRSKKEPGRYVGSQFVPNRIVRGKVVDALRDANEGLTFSIIGKTICNDWDVGQHKEWLQEILYSLQREELISMRGRCYVLC